MGVEDEDDVYMKSTEVKLRWNGDVDNDDKDDQRIWSKKWLRDLQEMCQFVLL